MWSQSYTGAMYWPIDPMPEDVYFDDLRWGLAREPRYRGQTSWGLYTVARHSVLVSEQVQRLATERGWAPEDVYEAAKVGLMHDAPEAWIGDVARPLKRQRVMRGYRKLEDRWWKCIVKRFKLRTTPEIMELVKEVDNRIVLDEVQRFMRRPEMWKDTNRYPGLMPLGVTFNNIARTADSDAELFRMRYRSLFDVNL
jgi:5'-deoxynucleotidase YfbR-like HD superfamily hydrolase